MKKTLLLTALCLATSTLATAQIVQQEPKLNASLTILMQQYRTEKANPAPRTAKRILTVGTKNYAVNENIDVTLDCDNAEAIAQQLQNEGFRATAITERFVTANIAIDKVEQLVAQPEIKHIELARRFSLKMKQAREVTNVDKIHNKEGLETPFTGKGVVLGVIDQGFQYKHPAFLSKEGKSRVIAGWIRRGQYASAVPWKTTPTGGEAQDSHATHVTGIAAGTEVGNGYGGVAPDADIIMIPSTFDDNEIIEDVKFIKETAEKAHKPWVVNMSFGSQLGPHDGTTSYDQAVDKLIGPGGLVTAANGNEGDMEIHGSATLKPGEKRYLIVDKSNDTDPAIHFHFWGQNPDGREHFKVTPVFFMDRQEVEPDKSFWKSNMASFGYGIYTYNKKQFVTGSVTNFEDIEDLFISTYPDKVFTDLRLALRIEALDTNTADETFHIWFEPKYGRIDNTLFFTGFLRQMVRGNDEYLVGEGASSIPSAISVASFNSATGWRSLHNGKTWGYGSGAWGEASKFTSPGPFLGTATKPLIAAPGSVIISAYNRYDKEIDLTTESIVVDTLIRNKKTEYYGAMQGTSMASPFMAGVLCLWLEAYPQLTYQQVEEIVKNTATRDNLVGTAVWTPKRGYGKINAYAGLKEVLALAKTNGIDRVNNSETPISLFKGEEAWKILFNNAERFAYIRIYSTDGRLVSNETYQALSQGQEITLSLSGLTPGAYLINIATAGSNTTRRVMVK